METIMSERTLDETNDNYTQRILYTNETDRKGLDSKSWTGTEVCTNIILSSDFDQTVIQRKLTSQIRYI